MKKIAENRVRKKQLILRTTEKEFDLIKKKIEKSKLKQNDYLLKCALEKDIIVIDGLQNLLLELVREGRNLNQISRVLNQNSNENFDPNFINKLEKNLMELWQKAEQILKEVKK